MTVPVPHVSPEVWNKLPINERQQMLAEYQTAKTAPSMTNPVPGVSPDVWNKLPINERQQMLSEYASANAPQSPPSMTNPVPGVSSEVWNKLPIQERQAMIEEYRAAHTTPRPPPPPSMTNPVPGMSSEVWNKLPINERQQMLAEYHASQIPPPVPSMTVPVPGVSSEVWNKLPIRERQDMLAEFQARPPGTVINGVLSDYLIAHPDIKTVQDLVNELNPTGKFESTARLLGLDPNEINKYRNANLVDWAILREPPPGTAPRTVDQANAYHITQFNTSDLGTNFNDYYTGSGHFSNNCGPASLAMALKVLGKMPEGLNPEQQIDYARSLIADGSTGTVTTATGQTVPIFDNDTGEDALVGYDKIVEGANRADLTANHVYGWGSLNDALANGQPVVAAGTIHTSWKNEFPSADQYGSAGDVGHFIAVLGKTADGKYLVSDPMYAGGAVTMTADQLRLFVGENPDITTIGP